MLLFVIPTVAPHPGKTSATGATGLTKRRATGPLKNREAGENRKEDAAERTEGRAGKTEGKTGNIGGKAKMIGDKEKIIRYAEMIREENKRKELS